MWLRSFALALMRWGRIVGLNSYAHVVLRTTLWHRARGHTTHVAAACHCSGSGYHLTRLWSSPATARAASMQVAVRLRERER